MIDLQRSRINRCDSNASNNFPNFDLTLDLTLECRLEPLRLRVLVLMAFLTLYLTYPFERSDLWSCTRPACADKFLKILGRNSPVSVPNKVEAISGSSERPRMKGGLHHGAQTMDVACSRPLRMWLRTRVPGTTLNCLFGLNEATIREAPVFSTGRFSTLDLRETRRRCAFISGSSNNREDCAR